MYVYTLFGHHSGDACQGVHCHGVANAIRTRDGMSNSCTCTFCLFGEQRARGTTAFP